MEMLQAGGDVAGGSFTVTSDTSGKQLKRGTKYLFPYGGSGKEQHIYLCTNLFRSTVRYVHQFE
ncbi:hypothetical protein AHAS_Ahas02G0182800 [Arachis hypogaea]